MGVGSSDSKNKLNKLLEKTNQKLTDILEYFQKKVIIKDNKEVLEHYYTIILLTVREIENIIDKIKEKKEIKIPQYSFSFHKIYNMKLNIYDLGKEIEKALNKIKALKRELLNLIDQELVEEKLNVSVIDDAICPYEHEHHLLDIIENAYDSNLNKFFIDNYIHNFIKLNIDGKNIYTKDVLLELKMAKYIAEIILFFKIFIKYYNYENAREIKITQEELKECSINLLNDEFALTNFLLFEIRYSEEKLNDDLTKDNEMALKVLIDFYLEIIKKIRLIENNIKKKLNFSI